MQPLARPFVGIALFVGVLVPFVFSSRRASMPRPPSTQAIRELHGDALTSLQIGTAIPVQDILPIAMQRATQVDGEMRAGPSHNMAIAANPFENVWRAPSIGGINLATGAYEVQDVDIALPAEGFSWPITRSYSARQESGGTHRDSNGVQGRNWMQGSQPCIALHDDATDTKDLIYLVFGADRFAEYRRFNTPTYGVGATYKGVNGAAGVFLYEAGEEDEPDTFTLTDQNGNTQVFFGFDDDSGVAAGQLWKITDPAGNVAYVGDAESGSTAIANGYDLAGRMAYAYDPSGRKFSYAYTELDSVHRLTQVKVEKNTGSWVTVAQVDYAYYSNESYGDAGDLKQVTITTPLTDSGVSLTQKKYYRYYEGSYNSSTNRGYPHALQYIYDFEGVRRYDWQDSTFDDDHLTATNASLQSYASAYFEYEEDNIDYLHPDDLRRITKAWFNGECGCSGGNNGTYEFIYERNSSFSNTANEYDEEWCTRTVVKRPDNSYLSQYWDEVGQPLSQVITDADPSGTSPVPSRWVTRVDRDSAGSVIAIYTPENCTGYTHSTGAITSSSSVGLVWVFERGADAVTGFVTAKKYQVGTSGTAYYDSEIAYGQGEMVIVAALNPGATEVIRPFVNARTRYPQTTSTSSSTYLDDHTLAWDGTKTLSIFSDQVIEPAVQTANNGSNSANSYTNYYRLDGNLICAKARDGVISYRGYTDGQLTTSIEDADTSILTDEPSGLTSTAGAFHRVTTYAYDNQGRLDLVTAPDGRKTKHYYSKLADGRPVELVYADYESTPKFYGPVQYTVQNLAGKVEVQATVGLTSNESTTALTGHVDESDADPITAMDLGSLVRLSTQVYNETGGTVQESRLYFAIPASGAGSDGTNYDATFYGYDDSGRKVRVKQPSGTITRTVHDPIGRVASHWMGTNDHDFSGGEASGTDDMVKTNDMEYDGGADDGNSRVTQRTQFVEDSTTDQRVTTYDYDARGRLLLQTNPTAPHAFYKYDNEGHTIATGLFSSTTSITLGSDDPTTETASRLALTESYYDELGRMWKSVRHEIDATDGSDDDTLLHLYWRDKEGRVIKEDGPQLSKTFYDRLGRTTHRFIIAEDNDSTYAHMDDVGGDTVLQEDETVYESETSDDIVMSVRIDRKHNDYFPMPTAGALDTNTDSDVLAITNSNIKGRAQITCSWYDRFGRVTDSVQYGNYGAANFDRDGLSVPSRSDTALVTTYVYGTDGALETVTDPRGLVTLTQRDDAGRTIAEVKNSSGVNSGQPANSDDNQTVRYEYVDGLRTKVIADMPSGETDQETVYIYGTSAGTPSAMKISTGHLLRAVLYPDSTNTGTTPANIASDDSDVVSYAYNSQGQETYRKDQAGNIYESNYDTGGRRTHQRVTTLASGFDGAVRRQSWTYDDLGRRSLVTQYDNAAVGSGSATDEVSYTYDGWGGITSYKQDKDSGVGGSGYYEVGYSYVKKTGGRNTVRRSTMTLPGSRTITFDYSTDLGDSISRVSKLKDGATTLAKYEYLGVGRVEGTTYPEPDIASTLQNGTGYHLDAFNRITKSKWTSTDPNPDINFYDVDLSYDRNSNITWAIDNVHTGFDVKYTMDDLDRLIDAEEGTESSGSITSRTRHQTWDDLDHLGNWDRSKLDLDGDDNWNETDEYDDTRTHNKVNELVSRDLDSTSGTTGDNYSLAYDAAGNLTDDGESYKYEYDAFYRLRKVKNQASTTLAEYRYNGLGHMIMVWEDTEADGDLDGSDVKFYPAYDEAWREVARYRESDSSPKEQFVNAMAGLDGYGRASYINDVVCRDRDNTSGWLAASDGTLEERYYYCPNWRGDVSVLVSSGRNVAEWVKYSAYGIPFGLPGGDADSDGDNDSSDYTQIQAWIDAPAYDVRGDVDLDGDVDSTDKALAQGAPIGGNLLGRGSLGASAIKSERGFCGSLVLGSEGNNHMRGRPHRASTGDWATRDQAGYVDGPNVYCYSGCNPIRFVDPYGKKRNHPHDYGPVDRILGCTGCVASGGGGPDTLQMGDVIMTLTVMKKHGECEEYILYPCTRQCVGSPCGAHVTIKAESDSASSVSLDYCKKDGGSPEYCLRLWLPTTDDGEGENVMEFDEEVACGSSTEFAIRKDSNSPSLINEVACTACAH